MSSRESGQREMILEVATRLFAALGYDGTSTRQIAEAVGLNVATVSYHVGSKRELYLAVMERAFRGFADEMEDATRELTAAPGEAKVVALHRLLDRYIDFCAEHPEFPALWMHRWLADATDVAGLEPVYVQPLAQSVIDSIAPLNVGDADMDFTVISMIWCIHSFVQSGVYDKSGERQGPENPRALARFRAHMHTMIHRTLGLPGEPPRV
ncbi:TetR/AcrR family transcriptional regulator [Nonomuraea muscovyensis]|uniref:AcrR family transcriptional regulator n=1 Tax=Nonomuraea muscovyensis TaxID=1124761 RepID=A0A7X0C0S4_9ACTN|nr:TetR family transcriptional regulator [Nonomuraea muscovyensis]MBB6346464.1 AcrR family transcriptional regulator [Nonomuraea muscovyensis]